MITAPKVSQSLWTPMIKSVTQLNNYTFYSRVLVATLGGYYSLRNNCVTLDFAQVFIDLRLCITFCITDS